MSKNIDRRVRKTRAQLRQGLAELLKEKSLKETLSTPFPIR